MTTPNSERDPLDKLAEEFAERYRRGEHPALTEYTDKHPELAEQIRDLFPALVEMEEVRRGAKELLKPDSEQPLPDRPMPRQLGEYRILREVGRGGMGVVYEAVQETLGRHVALKVLPFHGLLKATPLERFRREARAAAKLHHTNIVPVFGVGEHEGIYYYAMQFIQGQSLDTVLRELRHLRGRKDRLTPPAPPSQGGEKAGVPQGGEKAGVPQVAATGPPPVMPSQGGEKAGVPQGGEKPGVPPGEEKAGVPPGEEKAGVPPGEEKHGSPPPEGAKRQGIFPSEEGEGRSGPRASNLSASIAEGLVSGRFPGPEPQEGAPHKGPAAADRETFRPVAPTEAGREQ